MKQLVSKSHPRWQLRSLQARCSLAIRHRCRFGDGSQRLAATYRRLRIVGCVVVIAAGLAGVVTAVATSVASATAHVGGGGKIAFVRNDAIYVINPAGGATSRLPIVNRIHGQQIRTFWDAPAWSPDGHRLALAGSYFPDVNSHADSYLYLWQPNHDATELDYLGAPMESRPSWSPDAKSLAYDTGDDSPQIVTFSLATRKEASIFGNGVDGPAGQTPAWSPDGRRICFQMATHSDDEGFPIWGGLALISPKGTHLVRLTHVGSSPAWSPNGKSIVFAGNKGLSTIRPNGSHLKRLTSGNDGSPDWSPDGRQIAFERGQDVWLMNSDGSHQRLLVANASAPSLQP